MENPTNNAVPNNNMKVNIQSMHLSPLGLLVVLLTSLPGYFLITLSVFLNGAVFLSLIGALAVSHGFDRLITWLLGGDDSVGERMERQALNMVNAALPGFGQTLVNPSTRRLTALLIVLVSEWFSEAGLVLATTVFITGLYVEYVEQHRPVLGIILGVFIGGLAAAPFAYLVW